MVRIEDLKVGTTYHLKKDQSTEFKILEIKKDEIVISGNMKPKLDNFLFCVNFGFFIEINLDKPKLKATFLS